MLSPAATVRTSAPVKFVHINQLAAILGKAIHIFHSMVALPRCARAVSALPTIRQLAASTAGKPKPGVDDPAEHLPHIDPHWGPLEAPDEPPDVVIVEEQHGQQEPPSQKPPMWFFQVGLRPHNDHHAAARSVGGWACSQSKCQARCQAGGSVARCSTVGSTLAAFVKYCNCLGTNVGGSRVDTDALCAAPRQIPAQVNNFEAECLLPPQVPPHNTDHQRYPESLEPGFEKEYPDPYDPAPRC